MFFKKLNCICIFLLVNYIKMGPIFLFLPSRLDLQLTFDVPYPVHFRWIRPPRPVFSDRIYYFPNFQGHHNLFSPLIFCSRLSQKLSSFTALFNPELCHTVRQKENRIAITKIRILAKFCAPSSPLIGRLTDKF